MSRFAGQPIPYPAANDYGSRDRWPTLAVTWHMAEGRSVAQYLARDPLRGVAVHYTVEQATDRWKDGQVVRCLREDRISGSINLEPNDKLLGRLRRGGAAFDMVVIEKVESFGMGVGAEVFETVFWSGRFAEAIDPVPVERIGRKAVKVALCGDPRAKDPNVRQALIDRYGGKERAIGTKRLPGPLHGVAKDMWAALAVGAAWLDGATRMDATADRTAPLGRPVAPTGDDAP